MPPMPRDLQQQAHCWLPMLAIIDVALVNGLAQRVVPHPAQHDRQVRPYFHVCDVNVWPASV